MTKPSNLDSNPFLSQIIYPSEGLTSINEHAFLVGWNIEQFRCCISCVIVLPVEDYEILKEVLVTISTSSEFKEIFQTCSSSGIIPPIILGEWIPNIKSKHLPLPSMQETGIWITLTRDDNILTDQQIEVTNSNYNNNNNKDNKTSSKLVGIETTTSLFFSPYQWGTQKQQIRPKLYSIYSLGCSYATSCYMIEFAQIDTNKLCCLQLEEKYNLYDPNRRKSDAVKSDQSPAQSPRSSGDINSSIGQYSTFSNRRSMSNIGLEESLDMDLHFIIAQINASIDLKDAIYTYLVQRKVIDNNNLAYPVNNLYNLSDRCSLSLMWTPITWTFLILSSIWFTIITLIKKFVEAEQYILMCFWPIAYLLGIRPPDNETNQFKQKGLSLCDLSFLAAFLSKRLEAIEHSLYLCAQFPRSWKLSASKRQFIWLKVCSHAALITIDLLLGFLFGYLIWKHSNLLMDLSEKVCIGLEGRLLMDSLRWFNHSPAGIKLNPLITKKMGNLLRWALRNYGKFMVWTKPIHIHIVRIIACTGSMGITVQLAAIIDLVRVLSFHVAVIHRILAIQHHLQLSLISSLWNLFRGKKHNILRKRVDTCYYDHYQLLCGTILFAIAFFLLPSFAAYFYLFTLSQIIIVSFQVLLWGLVVIIKDYPFYTFATYLRDPLIFTFGVQFQLIPSDTKEVSHQTSSTESILLKMDSQSPVQMIRNSLREDIGRRDLERRRLIVTDNLAPNTSLPLLRSFQGKHNSSKTNTNLLMPVAKVISNNDTTISSILNVKKEDSNIIIDAKVHNIDTSKSFSQSIGNDNDNDNSNRNSWKKISKLFSFSSTPNPNSNTSSSKQEDKIIDNENTVSITINDDNNNNTVEENDYKDCSSKSGDTNDTNDIEDPNHIDNGVGLNIRKKELLTLSLSRNTQTTSLHSRFKRTSRTGKALGMPYLSNLDIASSRSLTPTGLNVHGTIYLSMSPRPLSYRNTFSAYVSHWNFFKRKHHFLYDLLQGIVSGWPALDIQLIQLTMDLSGNSNQGHFHEIMSNEVSKNFWDEIKKASGAKGTETRSLSSVQLGLNWLLLQTVLLTYSLSVILFFGGLILFILSLIKYNTDDIISLLKLPVINLS